MRAKVKVSVTVDGALLRRVERLAGPRSRSEVFGHALVAWVRQRAQAELDRAIEAYYREQTAAERRDDETWAGLGDEAVGRGWSG